MGRDGVLLMAFGGPRNLDEIAPFCANLMGRDPSPEVLERVRLRYLAIGGASPLPMLSYRIAERLGGALKDIPVAVGMRYSEPSIADGIDQLVSQGVDRVVTVSLSPFESPHSSGAYRDAVLRAVAERPGVTIAEAVSLAGTQAYLGYHAVSCLEALSDLPKGRNAILFTAHSLPVAETGEAPYVEQLETAAKEIARRADLQVPVGDERQHWLPGIEAFGSRAGDVPWLLTYQSRGQRPGEWLGPDIADVLRAMADAGFEGVVFSPIAFATDHMETLYDLDVEAAGLALDLDMEYARASVPNDTDEMIRALYEVIGPALGR